jgi:hypothetical protein
MLESGFSNRKKCREGGFLRPVRMKRFDVHRPIQSAKHDRDQPHLPLGDWPGDSTLGIPDDLNLAKDFASDPLTDAAGERLISVKKAYLSVLSIGRIMLAVCSWGAGGGQACNADS